MKTLKDSLNESFKVNEAKKKTVKTTIDKFFTWYAGNDKNWATNTETANEMKVNGIFTDEMEDEGLSWLEKLLHDKKKTISIEITDFGKYVENVFSHNGHKYEVESTDIFEE